MNRPPPSLSEKPAELSCHKYIAAMRKLLSTSRVPIITYFLFNCNGSFSEVQVFPELFSDDGKFKRQWYTESADSVSLNIQFSEQF